jgi:hypothetical protein
MTAFGSVAKEAPMAKFYFDFQKKTGPIAADDEGQDLPGLEEARAAAMATAREVLSSDVKFASNDPLIAIIIKDEAGQEIGRILAKDVLPEPLK